MGDKEAAKAAKDEGNKEFQAENYENAIRKYDEAIRLDPDEVQYPANRAMVHLKMKKWKEAEEDCDAALAINPDFGKVSFIFICYIPYIYGSECPPLKEGY